MELSAPAKINWDLHVLGRRADGFHELDSLFTTVALADRLRIEEADGLSLTCSDPTLPCDDRNLVWRAALALAAAAGIPARARLHLDKRIPTGGGLGGGSSDAAAALRGLNRLWGLDWPRERLAPLAARLGSDVPYFLWGGWCLCQGRGEQVFPLSAPPGLRALRLFLILPSFHLPTPLVYKALQAPAWDGHAGKRSLTEAEHFLSICCNCLSDRKGLPGWPDNGLLEAARKVEPGLTGLGAILSRRFPGRWQMSGSGAAHFFVPLGHEKVEDVREEIEKEAAHAVRVVETSAVQPDIAS